MTIVLRTLFASTVIKRATLPKCARERKISKKRSGEHQSPTNVSHTLTAAEKGYLQLEKEGLVL